MQKRVEILEKKVKELEAFLGKKPSKEVVKTTTDAEEDDICVIT